VATLVVGLLVPVPLINGRVMKLSLAAREMLKPSNNRIASRVGIVIMLAKREFR